MFGYEDLTLPELYGERSRLKEASPDACDAVTVYREAGWLNLNG